MSKAQKMFNKPSAKPILPDKKNFDGYPAFSVSVYEQYTQMVMVNTVGDTYYMSGDELFKYSVALHDKMKNTDPGFMARAVVYARNFGLMRLQPIIGLAYLSLVTDKSFFNGAFNKVIKTPNDLLDFISVVGSIRQGKGLGRSVKRAVNNWLTGDGSEARQEGLSQYHAIKYGGGEGKAYWALADVIKMVHPIPRNPIQSKLFNYLTKGERAAELNQINAVETLKSIAGQHRELGEAEFTKRVNALIDEGRLPYEIVTGIVKPNAAIWEHLMRQMPIFALVRNLKTLEEAGVFNKKENVDWVTGQLMNPDIIARSRMLPFRFTTAYKTYTGNSVVRNALKTSLDLSLSNIEMLPGRNAFFLDVSGSMSGEYLEVGSLLGLAALKKSNDAMFLCFGTELKYPQLDIQRESVMSNMDHVKRVFGGGTSTSLCMQHLLGTVPNTRKTSGIFAVNGIYDSSFPVSERKTAPTVVDNIVIFTDEQQNGGSPVVNEFRKYRKTVNKNAKLFIIDVAPYNSRMASQDEPGVTFIYGWSESVLSVLKYAMDGSGTHVEQIKKIRL